MSNDEFFDIKKDWSTIKDRLLRSYLMPYFTKILATKKPVRYIDCFAGAGRFKDGTLGSPLIAYEAAVEALEISKNNDNVLKLYFIEKDKNNFKSLVSNFENKNNNIIGDFFNDSFETTIVDIVNRFGNVNLFLYIDPYGVISLNKSILEKLNLQKLNTVELFINFNANGLFRTCCLALKKHLPKDIHFSGCDDFVEDKMIGSDGLINRINGILDGVEWQEIVSEKYSQSINYKIVEEELLHLYKKFLNKYFEYVIPIPIKMNSDICKYYMVYATNHPDGAVLMGSTMCNAKAINSNIYYPDSLFSFEDLDPEITRANLIELLKEYSGIHLNKLIGFYYDKYGLSCNVKDVLKQMEGDGKILVTRYPAFFKNTNKKSKSWTENANQKVLIGLNK